MSRFSSHFIALTALFVALGGSAGAAVKLIDGKQIKGHSIPASKLKRHSLTSAQIDVRRLGVVPSARYAAEASHANAADQATTANTATHSDTADRADTAGRADSAGDASTLAGHAPGDFVQGDGKVIARRYDGASYQDTITLPGGAKVEATCVNGSGGWLVENENSDKSIDMWFETPNEAPSYVDLHAFNGRGLSATAMTVTLGTDESIATFHLLYATRDGECHAQLWAQTKP